MHFKQEFLYKVKDMLSFRKERQDTCQMCDNNINKLNEEIKKTGLCPLHRGVIGRELSHRVW